MFGKRLISGFFLILAAIVFLLLGDIWLAAVLGLLSLIGMYELFRVLDMEKHALAVIAYAGAALIYVLLYLELGHWTLPVLVLALFAMLILYVIQYPKFTITKVAYSLFALLYVALMLSYIYRTRCLPGGNWLVWLIFIGSWGSDTCAYVVGVLIGRHHFSELSPKKTIEGCVGGVVGAGLIGFGYGFFYPYAQGFLFSPLLVFPAIAMVSAVLSQFGDLAASAVKRNFDTKDYGDLIPGHGGVLDRFDSVIFVSPFVYYLLTLIIYIRL